MFRIGNVSALGDGKVRVHFPDIDVVSYPLQIIWQTDDDAPQWMPKVTDQVLCLILDDRSGYILGKV